MQQETRACQNCKTQFVIGPDELAMYDKLSRDMIVKLDLVSTNDGEVKFKWHFKVNGADKPCAAGAGCIENACYGMRV